MAHGCHTHQEPVTDDPALKKKHRRALGAVMYINGAMAAIEACAGVASNSTALFTDMLEMAGDSATAALGRVGVNRSRKWQARASLVKAAGMMALGIGAACWGIFRIFNPIMPIVDAMTAIGSLAFVANASCVGILHKYRNDNLNLKSSYACVKNDMLGNIGVIGAGLLGKALASGWPDVIMSLTISTLFIKSSVGIMREAIAEIKNPTGKALDHCGHDHSHDSLVPKFVLQFTNMLKRKFNVSAAKKEQADGKQQKHHCDHGHDHTHSRHHPHR